MTEAAADLLRYAGTERSAMRPGLDRIHALLDALRHPEANLRILHVGGTNGKGSVAALSAAILQAAGLRTGLYTSPHLLEVAERIRIDGVMVPLASLARHAARIGPALESGAATFFEAMTAVALAAFIRRYPASGYLDSARFWLGNALYGKRDYKEAIAVFRAMIASSPDHPRAAEALLAVANCQVEMKDVRGARRTLDDLLKSYPKSEAAAAGRERLGSLKG